MTTARNLVTRMAAVAVMILTIAACGGQSSQPGNEGAAGSPAPGSGSLDITLRTDPDPVRTGENTCEVTVKDRGTPVTDATVSTELFMAAMPSMNMPEMRRNVNLTHRSEGVYQGMGQVIMAGSWDVTVKVMREGREIGRKKITFTAR